MDPAWTKKPAKPLTEAQATKAYDTANAEYQQYMISWNGPMDALKDDLQFVALNNAKIAAKATYDQVVKDAYEAALKKSAAKSVGAKKVAVEVVEDYAKLTHPQLSALLLDINKEFATLTNAGVKPSHVAYKKLMKKYNTVKAEAIAKKPVVKAVAPKATPKVAAPKMAPAAQKVAEPKVHVVHGVRGRYLTPSEESLVKHKIPPFTANEIDALNIYTGHSFREINGILRGTSSGVPKSSIRTTIKNMGTAFDKASLAEDVAVTRGLYSDAFGGIENLKGMVGKVFTEPGYMSTTMKVAPDFGGDVLIELVVPKGSKAISVGQYSAYESERELLLNRGSKLAIQSVERKGPKWIVKAILVP